ncbi:hypothetical protein HFP89_04445 [Wenzhouxiangella sp. XN79A]|uniref:hypothetical protein n=1 Tax=Wenzhouxiangella sp. XN79A TaxID=2724193 RepID=UPI00144AEE9D|nr:hypothetical protein [Wenzhouxiangella sp. XN79A]NKI34410.1 hypothetical protein [Wenzhouxiangella sp. XN79A]
MSHRFLTVDRRLPGHAPGLAALAALVAASVAGPVGALQWTLQADAAVAGGLRVERLRVERAADGRVEAAVDGLVVPALGALGRFRLDCAPAALPCREGRLQRIDEAAGVLATANWTRGTEDLPDGGLALARTSDGWGLRVDGLELAAWLAAPQAPVMLQSGRMTGRASIAGGSGQFDLRIDELGFDTADGRYAGAGLRLDVEAEWDGRELEAGLAWRAGEVLLGPAYLPSPPVPVALALSVVPRAAGGRRVLGRLTADGLIAAGLDAGWDAPGALLRPDRASLELEIPSLGALWSLGPESIAAGAGWESLQVQGRLDGRLEWRAGQVGMLDVELAGVGIDDPSGRLSIRDLDGRLQRRDALDRAALSFETLTLYALPFGPASLRLSGTPEALALDEPARIPLLDGALRLDRLRIERGGEGPPGLALDAALEPLSLAELTGRLGWPRFGGQLSGRFPSVRLDRETLEVAGGLDLELFDGSARIENLAIERPFGPLPALAGTLTLDRLDLAPLTAAFDFGAMQGSLSGYVRELRLLDWQPVAFDAWLYTPRDSRRSRRISQRAVDQIASLGGGGAAALSAPLLSLFDDFGYARVGIGCRLAGNVCRMRGLEELDGGGYRIVEGRGLPRLDVVGFRRQVDWPVLLAQLEAATRGDGPRVDD